MTVAPAKAGAAVGVFLRCFVNRWRPPPARGRRLLPYSINRGISSTKLQGLWRLSSWVENIPFHASVTAPVEPGSAKIRSEEHTSELQSLMRISYAVFCLKKKNTNQEAINRIVKGASS